MLHPANWPDWLQFVRLAGTLLATTALGIHAYDRHVREADVVVSARRWMYWLYAMVFLAASLACFTQLFIVGISRTYHAAGFLLGYLSLLLILSYVALIFGVTRGTPS